jgi:hypothetical protein
MKNKTYTLKPTKKQLKIMSLYFKMLEQEEIIFFNRVCDLEREMIDKTGIQELEFFRCDGEFVGIGNLDRTMQLISGEILEKT